MLCSKMLLNSPPVKFLLWGFQGPQPLATIPTAARLSTMRFRHFICMDSASGWHPRSDSLVFSLLEGVNKDQSPHQGEHSPTVLGNILTQTKGLLVPLCPCPREFLHSLDPLLLPKHRPCSRTCYGSPLPDAAHADPRPGSSGWSTNQAYLTCPLYPLPFPTWLSLPPNLIRLQNPSGRMPSLPLIPTRLLLSVPPPGSRPPPTHTLPVCAHPAFCLLFYSGAVAYVALTLLRPV